MPHTTFSGQLALLRGSSGSPPLSSRDSGANTSSTNSTMLLSKHLGGSHIVYSQIANLVSQLSKRNFRQTSLELSSICSSYGTMATLAMLKSLLSKIDLKSTRDQFKMQLLQQELSTLSNQPNFVSVVSQSFEDLEPLPHDYLHKLSKALKLNGAQELMLGVSLVRSHRPVSKTEGLKFLKSKLQDLTNIVKSKLPEPLLHELVQTLHNPNFDARLRESSLKTLVQIYKSFNGEPLPHVLCLAALEDCAASDAEKTMGVDPTSSADSNAVLKALVASLGPAQVIQDLGYLVCEDEAYLKVVLRQFGKNLEETKIARILGMMCVTHHGLEDALHLALYDNSQAIIDTAALASTHKPTTWNLSVFVSAVTAMAPKLNWIEVMHHLDYPEFAVLDIAGFHLLVDVFTKATGNPFPTSTLLSKWRNAGAQISMIKFTLQTLANPDTANRVTPVERLQKFDGLEQLLASSSPLHASFDAVPLIDALMQISEGCGYYTSVAQVLKPGKSHVLLLAILESEASSLLKDEFVTKMVSRLLLESNTSLKWSLLRRVWSLNQFALVDAMIHLYNKSTEHLPVLLEACQQVQALETILNLVSYTLFATDLAVLASKTFKRSESDDSEAPLLSLNAWLRNSISAESDVFVRSILQYVHSTRKSGGSPNPNADAILSTKRSSNPSISYHAQNVPCLSEDTISALLIAIKANEEILSDQAVAELDLLLPSSSTDPDDSSSFTTASDADSAIFGGFSVSGGFNGSALSGSSFALGSAVADMTSDDPNVRVAHLMQQLVEGVKTPSALLTLLATFKSSSNEIERDTFVEFVRLILTEFSFFDTYTEADCKAFGQVCGGLIQLGLLADDEAMQHTALHCIATAIKSPPPGPVYTFGLNALSSITSSKLASFSRYASAILEVPHFASNAPSPLVTALRLVAASTAEASTPSSRSSSTSTASSTPSSSLPQNPTPLPTSIPRATQTPGPTGSSKGSTSPARGGSGSSGGKSNASGGGSSSGSSGSGSSGSSSSSGGAGGAAPPPGGGGGSGNNGDDHNNRPPGGPSTNAATGAPQLNVAAREMVQPDEETRDRIHFILNNVSPSNLKSKAEDLAKVLKPQFFDYFASHLVSNRVSIDTKFQSLYLDLIDLQRSPDLFRTVLKTTYRAVHEILNSPKLTQSTERSWLKNLGPWLGSLTLARNRPIMFVDLALKELVLRAYEQGTLHAILPFVSRIIQTSVDSRVFRVPNPWFVSILRLLKEIHVHTRAQQNIKFEIEIMFQKIDEDLPTMPPSELLLQHTMYNGPSMKDFILDSSAGGASGSAGSSSSLTTPLGAPGTAPHVPGTTNWMPTLGLSPDGIFAHNPTLKSRLHGAFNKAIDDLVPEAEVTVSIVPKSTLRLVLKDFANEPDESKVLNAAKAMAKSLASSLLHATLRNHIRTATHNAMKASLELKAQYDAYQAQFHRAIDDNLEVACSVLAKHLVEKTLNAVEHELRPHLEQRAMHRDQLSRGLTTRPFVDQSQVSSAQQAALPDYLKIRPGVGSTQQQTALYDVFLRLPSLIQASMDQANMQQQQQQAAQQQQQQGAAAAAHQAAHQAASTAGMTAVDPSKVLGPNAGLSSIGGGLPHMHPLTASGGVPLVGGPGPSGLQHKDNYPGLTTKQALEKLEAMIGEHERWAQSIESNSLEAATDAQNALAALQRLPLTILRETQDRVTVATTTALRVFNVMYTNLKANCTAASAQSLQKNSACASSAANPSAAEENPIRDMYARILFAIARSTPVVVDAITQTWIQVASSPGDVTAQNASGANVTLEPYHRELTYALLTWQLLRADVLDPFLASEIAKVGTPASQKAIDFSMWLIKCAILGTHDASGNPSASGQQQQQQHLATTNLLSGSDLPRTLAELENAMVRARSSDVVVVQSCAQVALDASMQSRRVATHTDQLHASVVSAPKQRSGAGAPGGAGSVPSSSAGNSSGAPGSSGASSSQQQRQQQLMLRQQSLAKLLPQPLVTIFSEWVSLWQHGTPALEPMQHVLIALRNLRLVSLGDASAFESETHFLKGVIDAAVLAYLMQSQMQSIAQANLQPGVEPTPDQATCLAIQPYAAIDALTKLIVFLVKNYPENARHHLLQRVLSQTSKSTLMDHASSVSEFNQRPYFRLLSSLLVHISDPIFGEKLESLFLSSFADVLVELRPQQCPGFAFAWLELLSHRLFLPKLIRHNRALFALHKLLIFHLTFLEPYLAASKLNEAVSSLYQGTLRVFLVLIHDFPEFLCDFHHTFCDVLPPTCIQLRNLILSAFPRNIKLPDPALNIKMDQLPASKESPRVYNIEAELTHSGLRERVEEALKAGASQPPANPSSHTPNSSMQGPGGVPISLAPLAPHQQAVVDALFAALPSVLFHKDVTGQPTTYNVKFINSLVLFVGIAAISAPMNRVPMDIYMHLANSLDAEGRYHLFNAFANQLRFPSSHTQYFSWALLHIFSEAPADSAIPEQITRVLLERYIAQKPTPWGLAITYQELTKNQAYNFWTREFIKASPDIGRLFINLSRRSSGNTR